MKKTQRIDRAVGKALREERKRLGLSQHDVAKGIDKTFQQVQKYENGSNRVAVSTAVRMEQKTGIRINKLIESAFNA